jgi:hypothetical protein
MNTTFKGYMLTGILVCAWFVFAAYSGWRTPSLGSFSDGSGSYFYSGGSSYGRSSGGSWGGGK